MKKILFLSLSLLITNLSKAQSPEEMKAWQDYMTPGAAHEWMATLDGHWEAQVKMWMEPNQPAIESKAISVNSMIMGGRYQRSIFNGDLMGMPFEGESLMGYDNKLEKYKSTWVDNMGTGVMLLEGNYDSESKTLTLEGEAVDPLTGNPYLMKEVMRFISKDEHVLEMYMTIDGNEFKSMEIIYKRKQ